MDSLYHELILDHAHHPHNKGRLVGHVTMHRELNPSCGDEIIIYLRFEGETVHEVTFEGHGCAISQAAASLLTDHIKGLPKDALMKLTLDDINELLGIEIGATRRNCALLALRTIQKSLQVPTTEL